MKFKSAVFAFFALFASITLLVNAAAIFTNDQSPPHGHGSRGLTGPGRGSSSAGKGGKGDKDVPDVPGGLGGASGGAFTGGHVIGGVGGVGSKVSTIESQGYIRLPNTDRERIGMTDDWMKPYVNGMEDGWKELKVQVADTNRLIVNYAIHSQGQSYVTRLVENPRKTAAGVPIPEKMTYRDMIFDNYRAETGNSQLKTIGTDTIMNTDAANAIKAALAIRGKTFEQENVVVFTRGEQGWDELVSNNPFAQGPLKMIEEHSAEMGNAYIKSFTVISKGHPAEPDFHMVTEIGRN